MDKKGTQNESVYNELAIAMEYYKIHLKPDGYDLLMREAAKYIVTPLMCYKLFYLSKTLEGEELKSWGVASAGITYSIGEENFSPHGPLIAFGTYLAALSFLRDKCASYRYTDKREPSLVLNSSVALHRCKVLGSSKVISELLYSTVPLEGVRHFWNAHLYISREVRRRIYTRLDTQLMYAPFGTIACDGVLVGERLAGGYKGQAINLPEEA